MAKDLTSSRIDRQNILNNEIAIREIQDTSNIRGIVFEEKVCFTKSMIASFFDVESRTIERYVSDNADELMKNGYEILRGNRLKTFIQCVNEQDVPDINVGNILLIHALNKCLQSVAPKNLIAIFHEFICVITHITLNSS